MTTSKPSQQIGLNLTESQSMQSAEGSRAKTLVERARELGLEANAADYGRSSPDLLANWNPDTSSWKTSQTSLFGESTSSSVTWPRSGMMRNGIAYKLPTLARPISEIGSLLLPTLLASDRVAMVMRTQGHLPRNFLLGADFSKESIKPEVKTGGPLNPTFAEWLMGFAIGHTDYEC